MRLNRVLLIVVGLLITTLNLSGNPMLNHWVAYSPSDSWQPGQEAESLLVWRDLEALSFCGFDGIITYGTLDSLCRVPRLARGQLFRKVIMGVWIDSNMTTNQQGIDLAINYSEDVDAICVGNEALFFNYVDTNYLREAMENIRFLTSKPVTTSEHWSLYFDSSYQNWLLQNCDFLLPIINPTDNGIFAPIPGALWVKAKFDSLRAVAGPNVEVIVKEAGWPTNSDSIQQRTWANEDSQYRFFRRLDDIYLNDTLSYFCFEAFDGWWKTWGPTQRYWGLFDTQRHPKLYAQGLGINEAPNHYQNPYKSHIWASGLNSVFENPLNKPMTVFDITGRKIVDFKHSTINLPTIPPGIYFIKFREGEIYKTIIIH